jgi:hypothetical protein
VKEVTADFNRDGTENKKYVLEGPGIYPPAIRALLGDSPSQRSLLDLRSIVESAHRSGVNNAKAEIREALGLRTHMNGDVMVRKE